MTQILYTAHSWPRFGTGRQDEAFLQTFGIDEFTATNSVSLSNRLTFENGLLVKKEKYDIYTGQFEQIELYDNEKQFEYRDIPTHKLYGFDLDPEGVHQLGGSPPKDFIFPTHHLPVDFQYFGYLDKKDELFDFLPFDRLHLIYPMFADCFQTIYMDYSNPHTPKLVHIDAWPDKILESINSSTKIVYESKKFSSQPQKKNWKDITFAIGGIPYGASSAITPLSLFTLNPMKFLIGFNNIGGHNTVKVLSHNIAAFAVDYEESYLRFLDFCYHSLMIFIEPETKLVAYCPVN